MKRTRLAIAGVITAVVAVAGIGAAVGATSPAPRTTATVHKAPSLDGAGPISAASQKSLKAVAVDFVPGGGLREGSITESDTLKSASKDLNLVAGVSPSEVAFGTITIKHSGKVSDDPNDARVTGQIVDRPVVLLVFSHVKQPLSHPYVQGAEASTAPTSYVADLWIAIDAKSGEFVRGGSLF